MKRLFLVILFCLTGAGAFAQSPAPAPIAELPYRIDYGGLVIVNVSVNGQGPFDFIVDTGATITVVFENLTDRIQLPSQGNLSRRVIGISATEEVPVHSIETMSLGGLRFDNRAAVKVKNWTTRQSTPQGIIGLDILENYFVIFDNENQLIKLYAFDDAPRAYTADWSSANLKRLTVNESSGHIYSVNASIYGNAISMIVDLGAADAIMNYAGLRQSVKYTFWSDPDEMAGTGISLGAKYSDLFNNTERAKKVRFREMVIADIAWRYQTLVVLDALIFEELGVKEQPYGMLGADILLKRNFALDFQNKQLLIGPKAKPQRRS